MCGCVFVFCFVFHFVLLFINCFYFFFGLVMFSFFLFIIFVGICRFPIEVCRLDETIKSFKLPFAICSKGFPLQALFVGFAGAVVA